MVNKTIAKFKSCLKSFTDMQIKTIPREIKILANGTHPGSKPSEILIKTSGNIETIRTSIMANTILFFIL
jgi:hypothetical protein